MKTRKEIEKEIKNLEYMITLYNAQGCDGAVCDCKRIIKTLNWFLGIEEKLI